MKITIVMKGCQFSMEVGPQEPILEIKRKIQQFLGIPIDSQTLTVCDWELVDGLDLADYPLISEGTKMHLSTPQSPPPEFPQTTTMKITVKFSSRKIEIDVDKTDTVRSLKEKIHIVDATPIKRMTLFFRGSEMGDDFRSLSEYGMEESSEVVVFLKNMNRAMADPPSRRLAVVVQTASSLMNAARIPVEMNDTSRVEELRRLLVERRIVPVDEYIFIHKQRIMREDCSLRWHGVENGDYLYVFKGTVSRGGF
ncbi:Ubiquitin-like protein [Handroanthus impetiginosus]|uniref:Ubiquitin-like protein n=1 Tax=Handroanthus impetiginosus TaxID=429701 RepID=A0A2G9HBU4_9LAMI|nr:Ubiquitin-like protein [Handroanthus impetiginosus]